MTLGVSSSVAVPANWQRHYDLTRFNTLGFQATAEYFCQVDSEEQLLQAIASAKQLGLSWRVLGGGSNVVLLEDLPGLTVHMHILGKRVRQQDRTILLEAGAGENWHQLVLYSLAQGWQGLENLALIPGTLGAAPVQNIGAYGVELADVLVRVRCLDSQSLRFIELENQQCRFAYRDSLFKQAEGKGFIITAVELRLQPDGQPKLGYAALNTQLAAWGIKHPTPAQVAEAVIAVRQSKLPDPAVLGNAGSFFKNPWVSAAHYQRLKESFPALVAYPDGEGYKLAAGWLIDQLGYKGMRRQGVGVHEQQALVLVHYGQGDGRQLQALAAEIRQAVWQRYQVELEQEPQILP